MLRMVQKRRPGRTLTAQAALCPRYRMIEPNPEDVRTYKALFARFRELYFTLANNRMISEGTIRSPGRKRMRLRQKSSMGTTVKW